MQGQQSCQTVPCLLDGINKCRMLKLTQSNFIRDYHEFSLFQPTISDATQNRDVAPDFALSPSLSGLIHPRSSARPIFGLQISGGSRREYKARANKKAIQHTLVECHTSYKIMRQPNTLYLPKFYRCLAGVDHACLKGLSHYFEGSEQWFWFTLSRLSLNKCKVLNARGKKF